MNIPDQNFIQQFSSSISLKDDGIYYADSNEKVSYPDDGNDISFELEENSFWFRHRNHCIVEMVRNYPPTGNGPIFDVGGGNGFVAKGLMNAGWETVVVEPGASGARNAKKRGLRNIICATTKTAKFNSGTLPAIGVFDVVEHIENDIEFLNHLWELLIPGGMLYITVPAYKALWSLDDERGGHFRRYTLSNLTKKIQNSSFYISYSTYIFSYLPLFIFLIRRIPYKLKYSKSPIIKSLRNDHYSPDGIGSKILNLLHKWEIKKINKHQNINFGGSCMLAVQKARLDV